MKHPELIVGGLIVVLIAVIGIDSSARRQSSSVVKTPISQKQIAVVNIDDSNISYRNFPVLGVAMKLSDEYVMKRVDLNTDKDGGSITFVSREDLRIDPDCYVGIVSKINKKDLVLEVTDDMPQWVSSESLMKSVVQRGRAKEFENFFLLFQGPQSPCFEGDKVMDRPLPPGPSLREAVLSAVELK